MSDKIELLHDNPLKFKQNDDKYEQDGLNFKTYTKVITNAILNTQTPFTVGIFGEWGKGKTSFLEIIKQKIEHDKYKDNNITVWFNAWQYEKEEHPIVPLLAVIIKALNDEKGEVRKGFEKFANVLRSVAYGFSVETTNKDVLGNELKMQLNSKDMIDRYEQLVASALLDKSLYFNAFEKLEALESLASNKIIVFIDDLDRCLPPNAIKLLESIKLVLSQKGFVFVLGVAKEVLEGHLNHKYEKEFGIEGGNHGKSYLEKMIQLPFTLPKFTQKVESLVDSLFSKIDNNGDNLENIKEVINAIATHSKVTPRLLVRIINQAKIHSEIDKELKNDEIYDDMYAAFVFVLLLDTLYEEEYKVLSTLTEESLKKINEEIKKPNKFEELSTSITKLGSKALKSFSGVDINLEKEKMPDELSKLIILIKDNFCLESLLLSKIGQDWLTTLKLRERTIEFIDIATNVSEEEIKKQEKTRIKNIDLEKLRTELISLEEKIKDEETFQREMNVMEYSYKTFIDNLVDEKGNKFEFSKFLVTNIWYKEFINSYAYKKEEIWSPTGWKFINLKNFIEPKYLEDKRFNHDFKPIVGVSYYEAEAFCNWLSDKSKDDEIEYIYTLPTKKQFEYLASNENTTMYPWGNDFDSRKCNNSIDLYLEETSIVGAFSKNGICDMSGNIWKWTSEDNSYRNVGGSWNNDNTFIFEASSNIFCKPVVRNNKIGFFITRTKVWYFNSHSLYSLTN